MVIVHLSANLRRIISPEKNETLYQLFKRFCQEFSYREEEYEFQSYPEDNRVPLDININANRVKEVSLVQKRVSRRNSDEPSYTVIRDVSPVIVENRKKNAASCPVANRPNERPASEQIIGNIKPKKQPKRNAPKAPVINNKITDDKNETKIPDFDIPPPPEFMPHEETADIEPYYKSVQCDTKKSGTDQSSRGESVTEASESYLPPLEICHRSDKVNESDKEDINNDDNENAHLNINFRPISDHIESDSESSVEDVYEDESLLGNQKRLEKLEVKSSPSFEDKDEGDKCDELQSNDEDNLNIKLNEQITTESMESLTNEEWKHPDHVSFNESVQILNCPMAEMEETDIKSSNEHLSDSADLIDYNVVKSCESQANNEEEIEIDLPLNDHVDNKANYEDPSALCGNDNTDSNNDEAPKPKTRVKHEVKSKAASLDSGEILDLPRSHSEISTETTDKPAGENEDISIEDGHPTDFPITIISEPSNPKFYWELPKQSKTIQIMSRAYNTIDIPEPKVVQKIEQSKAPSTAPKPPKEVKVIVQEAPSEQSARPTFRQRPTKTFFFTAAPSDANK